MKRPAALLLLLALAMGTPLTQKPATVTEMVTTEEVSASTEEPTGTIVDPTTEQSDLVSDEVEGVTDSTVPGISTNEPNISTTTPNTDYQPPRHIPTLLEEKLDLLGCDLPLLPPQSRVWKGNETHELLLPITVSGKHNFN
ncbi:PREDICTED: uncharacterized protein LOC108556738 [Nicrophorus vespilloides]|uniref:Uncharacterized protein LOC108556738 n=1 Tax=Nicrophorus vespilloides TaxID=110193 RepID=A0ABM1M1J0_NICVS|nr:PREDICTED: uncharacterized protein LOC108556738 [Nicrophorus vespilloides]